MMRDEKEIERAHGILASIVVGEAPDVILDDDGRLIMRGAFDALCWILGHDHNTMFEQNFARIEAAAAAAGYRVPPK
jgi:hypothetical protein